MLSMETLNFVALFCVLLTELYAVHSFISPSKPFKQNPFAEKPLATRGQDSKQGHREGAAEEREQVNSVTVSCLPDSLEIVIQADLFGVGASVKGSDLRLGVDNDERCKAVSSSNDEYRITAGLLDCGTKHWMTEESLVYTNLLIYSPEPSAGGVIRMEEAVIPVECHYERKYSLTSSALFPIWIPFVSTMATMEKLNFALKVMTPDWLYKRPSNVFYLGEPIPIEASVTPGHHMGLRVFLNSCVATLTPDEHSSPRYVLIDDGCLLDSQVPNSRSQFSSRVQDDKLHLVIDAFRFHNENKGELYITCQMIAVPVNDADSPSKACTFINGRWRSADGNDYLCGYCQTQNEEGLIKDKLSGLFSPRGFGKSAKPETLWRSELKTDQEQDKEAIVGPLLVLPVEKKTKTKFNLPLYGSTWRSGVSQNTVKKILAPEVLSSSEEEVENVPETQKVENVPETGEDSPNVTNDDADYETSKEEDVEHGFDVLKSEKMGPLYLPILKEGLENETTASSSNVGTSPLPDIDLTTSLNDTDSVVTITVEPKR